MRQIGTALALALLLAVVLSSGAAAVDESAAGTESSEEQADDEKKKKKKKERAEPPVLRVPHDDTRVGKQEAAKVAAMMGVLPDSPLTRYVKQIGARVARYAPKTFTYTFNVVDQDTPNAFALPGGYIYVSRGLLLLSNDETEVANVLGHEISHVASRHAAARQQVVEGVPGIFQFLQFASLAAYGRNQERTADKEGQALAGKAGYDPGGMARFLKQMEFGERLRLGSSRIPSFRDTHPSTARRVADAAGRANQIPWTPKPPISEGRAGFLAHLDGLSVGLPAAEGVFVRNRFLQPDMGFSIRFPESWEARNTHSAVGAVSPKHNAQVVLEFGGQAGNIQKTAMEFIEESAEEGLRLDPPEPLQIRGLPALRATGSALTPRGPFRAVVTWIEFGNFIFRITGISLSNHHEALFINTARSFRAITPRELAQIKEERLRIVHAQQGETLQALSRRTNNIWNVNVTAVMNGVHTTQSLEKSFPVKIARAEKYVPKAEPAAVEE